jgi:hypothetical protein
MANAQNVDRLLRKVANAENVESVKAGNFLMSIARTAARASGNPIPRINSVEVYDLSASCTDFKQNLMTEFQQLKDGNGYETLMQVKDSGDNVRIMMKKDRRNTIRELVLFVINDNDPTVIRISGRITEDEIAQLVSQHSR